MRRELDLLFQFVKLLAIDLDYYGALGPDRVARGELRKRGNLPEVLC
jgi:hypothetical protein